MVSIFNTITDKLESLILQHSIIYSRVSDISDVENTSLDDQIKKCEDFCKHYKMKIVEVFREKASAKKTGKRPKFNKMVHMFKENKAKVLICAYSDRLTRNGTDADIVKELIDDYGITVVFVVQSRILKVPVDPADYLVWDTEIAFANYRVRLDNQRCQAGILAKNLSGFRTTQAPYGYMNDSEIGRAIVIESRANFVRKAFELYGTGNYSIPEVANELFELGFMYELQTDKKIPTSTLDSMLRNLFYTGKYYVKKADEYVNGTHEAIISNELFEKVQNLLNSNPKAPRKHKLLYSKLITCGNCGHYMTGDVKIKPNGKKYIYYRCTNSKCKEKTKISEVALEDNLSAYLKEIQLGLIPDGIVTEVLKDELSDITNELSELKRKPSRKFHSVQRIKEIAAKNDIVDEQYISDKINVIEGKYGDLDAKISYTEQQIEKVKSKLAELREKRLYNLYSEVTTPTKRNILKLVANIFKCDENGLKMTFHSAFRKIRRR